MEFKNPFVTLFLWIVFIFSNGFHNCQSELLHSISEVESSSNVLNKNRSAAENGNAGQPEAIIVRPVVHDPTTRTSRRPLRSIGCNQVDHAEFLTILLDDPSSLVLDIKLERNLIPEEFSVRHHVNGTEDFWMPKDQTFLRCHYRGMVRNVTDSWVTLSTCFGLKGTIYDGKEFYYIEPVNGNKDCIDGDHLWRRHWDRAIPSNTNCPYTDGSTLSHPNDLTKRSKRQSSHVSPSGTNNHHSIELTLVIDYRIYQRNNGNIPKILDRVLSIANIIGQIYSSLGITIVLVGVVMWSEGDQIYIGNNLHNILASFKQYRRAHLNLKHHDIAHLMIGVKDDHFKSAVGRAYVGTVCSAEESCGVAVDNGISSTTMIASYISHEMGHNLGMHHDNITCSCPTNDCVMAESIGAPTSRWSSCSHDLFRSNSRSGAFRCLNNQPKLCGNMIVDPGEECDCGLPHFCHTHCCDPHTCKFAKRTPAVKCADGFCCDLESCQWELPGVQCRPAKGECDLPEHCSGTGKNCPEDLYKYNGITCSKQKICFNKTCEYSGKAKLVPSKCPVNCTQNGVCNNLGKCHCNANFDPTTNCQQRGFGGSEDGGQTMDPKVPIMNKFELYIVFLAVIPIIIFLFTLSLYYLTEEQRKHFWQCICSCILCRRKGSIFENQRPALIQSISIDKGNQSNASAKRNFRSWVRNKVRLTLTTDNTTYRNVNSPCSTATTLSTVNTPDSSLSTPVNFLPQTPNSDRRLLLVPPVQMHYPITTTSAPPVPKCKPYQMGASNPALETDDAAPKSATSTPPRTPQFSRRAPQIPQSPRSPPPPLPKGPPPPLPKGPPPPPSSNKPRY